MSEFNPTPGPWKVVARPSTEGFSVNGPEHVICPDVCATSLEQRRDNALLIAAAPELLAAIRDIAAETTKYDSEEIIANIQGICATTLAKVEGRTK